MNSVSDYVYGEGDLLTTPMVYSYSDASGAAFLRTYLHSRSLKITELASELVPDEPRKPRPVSQHRVYWVWRDWIAANCEGDPPEDVELFLKRFAVTKRIWTEYSVDLRPRANANHRDLALYAEASELTQTTYELSGDSRYFNAALQLNDILCAHSHELTMSQKFRLFRSISRELCAVTNLLRGAET